MITNVGIPPSPATTSPDSSAKFRKSVLHVADARMNLIGEIVDGIKTVKLNSLDAAFRHRVEVLRVKELSSIRRALTLYAYNQVCVCVCGCIEATSPNRGRELRLDVKREFSPCLGAQLNIFAFMLYNRSSDMSSSVYLYWYCGFAWRMKFPSRTRVMTKEH